MASQGSRSGHLDATAGRDIVFCHACEEEWYQDEHGLICPQCESEVTEIVTPENDPRRFEPPPSSSSSGGRHRGPRRHDSDSDPEEADIEEHLHQGRNGFLLHSTIWRNSTGGQQPRSPSQPNARQPPDPNDGDQIVQRFIDMVNDFGNGMPPARGEHESFFPPNQPGLFGGGSNVRTYTTRGGNGGSTSFTIATGPIHVHGAGGARSPGGLGSDPFQSMFSEILNGAGPPQMRGPGFPPGNRAPGIAASLHDILNMLNPANAMHGDAVYSQEALDRIISALMESNPQSNAAPPATEDALKRLERKKVDVKMLGPEGKAECTICIDEFSVGDEVVVLPCHHWFHDQCVVMWLKEHNTCPICRTPIEERNNNPQRTPDLNSFPGSSNPSAPEPAPSSNNPWISGPLPTPRGTDWEFESSGRRRGAPERTPSGSGETSSAPPPRPSPYDPTSRVLPSLRPRRNSLSPPTPRAYPAHEQSSRTRQRSPSSVDRDRDRTQESGHGHGPLGWLRDQFSRGSGSGNGSSRERRRS